MVQCTVEPVRAQSQQCLIQYLMSGSTLYTVHCTLYTIHCTLYTVHCTLYTVLYSVDCLMSGTSCCQGSFQSTSFWPGWQQSSNIRHDDFRSDLVCLSVTLRGPRPLLDEMIPKGKRISAAPGMSCRICIGGTVRLISPCMRAS